MNEVDKKLKKVAAAVSKLPPEAIQRSYGVDTHKGYDTTGYGIDWLWELLVAEFGPSAIIASVADVQWEETETKSGRRKYVASLRSTIRIMGEESEVLAEASAFGGHEAFLRGDALKGAETNALKKALARWGIGIEAYKGTIDDDNKPLPEAPGPSRQAEQEVPLEDPSGHDLIREWMEAAALVAKLDERKNEGWAYREYFSYEVKAGGKKTGEIKTVGKKTMETWLKKPVTPKKRRWVEDKLKALYEDFPSVKEQMTGGMTADDIEF